MTTANRVQTHRERVKQMKLRQCMQTLHAAGVTIEELEDYIKEHGFSNQEEKRRKKLDKYRQNEIARQKRLQALEKARKTREAKKLEKQQEIEETTQEVFK